MKKILLLSTVFSLLFVSCNSDEVGTFGPNQTIVGFTDSFSATYITDFSDADLNVPVNLVSYQNETYPSDVNVQWSVDDSSTAVEGVDYDMPASTNALISSGTTVGNILINVHPNLFDPFNPTKLVLNMVSVPSANAIIGAQYQKVTITLQGVCSSNMAGHYSTSTLRVNNGAVYTFADEEFVQLVSGGADYKTSYVGAYYGAGQVPGSTGTALLAATTNAGYTFTDICNNIKLETQNLGSAYTNEVRQTPTQFSNSHRNPATGVVTVYYSVWFTGNTIEREFISTYTPL